MKSAKGGILYIGKAISLKKRVASHFSSAVFGKARLLTEQVEKINYISCQNPQQALILEAALIKEKKPKFNVALKDGKSYPYITISKESYPRVLISRLKEKKNNNFFGPYTDTGSLKQALRAIREVFPFCSCLKRGEKICLYYHISLCPGPCAKKITRAAYNENIYGIKKILKGKIPELIAVYRQKMKKLALREKFEAATACRDKIYALENIFSFPVKQHGLLILKEKLGLPALPLAIEAIDISVLSQSNAVGSLVSFKNGEPDKKNYRRFLIKKTRTRDDCGRIKEIVFRRYSRLLKEKKPLPDLILIDGGQGQLKAAQEVLCRISLKVPVIALAKKNEEIWLPERKNPLIIPKSSPGLHLLQKIRDQAHRFARAYHLLRREKSWKKTD